MDSPEGKILIVDVNRGLVTALGVVLRRSFSSIETCSQQELTGYLTQDEPEMMLIELTGGSAQKKADQCLFIKAVKSKCPHLQIIAIVSFADADMGPMAVKDGATDYMVKPWNNDKMAVAIYNARRMRKLELEVEALEASCALEKVDDGSNMDGAGVKSFSLGKMERRMIKAALRRSGGNVMVAAQMLGITRQTLYNKCKRFKIEIPNR